MTRKRKKNPTAVALGTFGTEAKEMIEGEALSAFSRSGGRGRALKLTSEQRRAIAQRAAQARWGKKPPAA